MSGSEAGNEDEARGPGGERLGGLVSQLRRGLRAMPPSGDALAASTAAAGQPAPSRSATQAAPGPQFPPELRDAARRLLSAAGLLPSEGPTPTLVLVDQRGARHLVGRAGVVIGRSHGTGAAVDVAVDHPAVSRRHAVVSLVVGSPAVADARSTNGTWIARAATMIVVGDAPVALQAQDRILAGGDVVLCDVVVDRDRG